MKNIFLFFSLLTNLLTIGQQNGAVIKKSDFKLGETLEIHSTILKENRTLNIYLPQSYSSESTQKYPVIYLLDGSADEDFIHITGLVQFLSFSWINILPESIVVGIGNIDRKRDFTYPSGNSQDQTELPTSGKSKEFIQFLQQELQPFITENYRATHEKTIIGQSLGGLLATEILFKHPDMFDRYIIVSPSLWWDDEKLQKTIPKVPSSPKSIFIAVGKEGNIMEQVARDLHLQLQNHLPKNTELHFGYFEDKSHGDTLHMAVYKAFETFFKSPKNK